MSLDFTKLTDAVAKVASLAASHADVSSQVSQALVARDAALADLSQAQIDIDAMAAQLISAATTPAEAAGLTAVATALSAPVVPLDAPSLPAVNPVPALGPVAGPVLTGTFLPGDPRAAKA